MGSPPHETQCYVSRAEGESFVRKDGLQSLWARLKSLDPLELCFLMKQVVRVCEWSIVRTTGYMYRANFCRYRSFARKLITENEQLCHELYAKENYILKSTVFYHI